MISQAMKAEMLDQETELQLARSWHFDGNEKALHRLVNAYMRLAVSMASKYRRYDVDVYDLSQEAGVGLMKAARKFDPERGVRFSTYAIWWIKASIQDYVMRNWSMVRTGSTSSQKSLFFNLKRVRTKIEREAHKNGAHVDRHMLTEMISDELGVSLKDVTMMDGRLSGSDFSLNSHQVGDEGREWLELLEDETATTAERMEVMEDVGYLRRQIISAMMTLTEREKIIVSERKLKEKPRTLASLGAEFGLSKERIRQLENRALGKLKRKLLDLNSVENYNIL
jgi:RNA polymerase sigma-32 factor